MIRSHAAPPPVDFCLRTHSSVRAAAVRRSQWPVRRGRRHGRSAAVQQGAELPTGSYGRSQNNGVPSTSTGKRKRRTGPCGVASIRSSNGPARGSVSSGCSPTERPGSTSSAAIRASDRRDTDPFPVVISLVQSGDHRSSHLVAGREVDRLDRKMTRPVGSNEFAQGVDRHPTIGVLPRPTLNLVCQTAAVLDQAAETAPTRPRAGPAIGVEGDLYETRLHDRPLSR